VSDRAVRETALPFPPHDPEEKLARAEAARYLGIGPRTLEGWALRGDGPAYLKLGTARAARVVYRRRDLDAFAAMCERRSTSDAGRAA
jgi:hypothetical protein